MSRPEAFNNRGIALKELKRLDEAPEDFGAHLRHALTLDVPSLIVLPIDYSLDVAISEELGTETVAT